MQRKKLFAIAASICLILQVSAQDKVILSGYVKDVSNGETLIGSSVVINELGSGTVTNVYGFYSVTIPPGEYTIDYRFVGYETITKKIDLDRSQRIDIELKESDLKLQEIVVTAEAEDANVTSMEMSTNKLDIQTINQIPSLFGEADIVKSIQLLPGVSTVGEGASGFNVRGGSVGQNLILLDEAPVYNSSHLFGFFSVFNPDAVKDVKLYKGGVPARFGGRVSSLLDVRMKEGNNKTLSGQGGIGSIFSRLSLEGPIVKDKGSFIIAGRRSYVDIFAKLFTDVLDEGAGLYFYDLTAKVNYNLGQNDRIFLSGYSGRDVFNFDANQGFSWGNQTATLRWNHIYGDKLFSNLSAVFSDYDYELAFGEDENDKFTWKSRVRTYDLKPQFNWFLNDKHNIFFGGEALYYEFEPANAITVSEGKKTNISLPEKYALETSLYIENEQKVTPKLSVNYGIRWSNYGNYGNGKEYQFASTEPGRRKELIGEDSIGRGELIQTYSNFEPRLSLTQVLKNNSSVKFSFTRMAQYLHLVSNTTASIPLDVWTPSTNNIKPQIGYQYSLGYFRNFKDNLIETSAEVYYKDLQNQVDYIDGADLLINEFLEGDLLSGVGRAYGLELYAKKTKGKINGWVSYTLAKSELKTEGISNSNWYRARYDQRHNFKLVGIYGWNDRKQLSFTFTATSGTPTTFPNSRYLMQEYITPHNSNNERNNVSIPWYHRLDVSLKFIFQDASLWGKQYKHDLTVGIYNIYGRKNPFSIYFVQDADKTIAGLEEIPTEARQVSILGTLLPSISYNFKF